MFAMTGITAVLLFAAWVLFLAAIFVGYRVVLVLGMKKKANEWTRGTVNPTDPALVTRASHAHLNTLETLPVFAAIVFAAAFLGKSPVVDALAGWVLVARIGQSVVHLIGTSAALVFVRANLFLVQVGLMVWMIWALLH